MRVRLCMSDFVSRRSLCICTTALHQVNVSCVFPSCWGQREEVETFLSYCVTGAEERRCSWWLINAKLVVSGSCFPELPSRAPGAKLPQGQYVDPLEIDEEVLLFVFFLSWVRVSLCSSYRSACTSHLICWWGLRIFHKENLFLFHYVVDFFQSLKLYQAPKLPPKFNLLTPEMESWGKIAFFKTK